MNWVRRLSKIGKLAQTSTHTYMHNAMQIPPPKHATIRKHTRSGFLYFILFLLFWCLSSQKDDEQEPEKSRMLTLLLFLSFVRSTLSLSLAGFCRRGRNKKLNSEKVFFTLARELLLSFYIIFFWKRRVPVFHISTFLAAFLYSLQTFWRWWWSWWDSLNSILSVALFPLLANAVWPLL